MVASLPDRVRNLEERGLFNEAKRLANRILVERAELPTALASRLRWEPERIDRISKDYALTPDEAFGSVRVPIPDLTQEEFDRWVKDGLAESREIEGRVMIFKSFLPNLLRDSTEAKRRVRKPDETTERARNLLHEHIDALVANKGDSPCPYSGVAENRILMTVKAKAGAVPDGEIVRAWIPFPRKDPLQPEISLVSTVPDEHALADQDSPQRTIYMEREATGGGEVLFQVEYRYLSRAFYQEITPSTVEPVGLASASEACLCEQLPHIAFTPYLRGLAEEIVRRETNPYMKAWHIYRWITETVSYALVPEYSTIECISDYAARNLRGDCGVQALLFITLCRISGVPARWQSGWYVNPIRCGPHDWAQFYVEPYGWIYADPSFGGRERSSEKYHRFYFGNVDHFRLITNIDISSEFSPAKSHYRSDTVDNQRGEVEWRGGNVYYDGWDYELKILPSEERASERK